jgi:HlyD family secretion protein
MKKKWKITLGAVLLIFIILMVVIQTAKPLETKLLILKKEDIAKTFKEEGIVKAEKETIVSSLYGGKLTGISVKEGDNVQAGDVLATFDSQELHYQIQALEGQLRSIEAQKDLEELTIDLETKKLLYEAGALSQQEYEEAQNTLNSDYYPALLSTVKAQINQLKYQVAQKNAIAPLAGTIAELQVKEGMVISPATPLLTIFSANAYKVETYVLTEDASRLQPKMEVKLIQDSQSGDLVFNGTVEQIAPSAVEKLSTLGLIEQRLKVTITPQIPKELVLKPGYALDVEFTLDKQENQLVIPKTVLFPYNDGNALWVVKDGKAEIRPVTKGFENDKSVAITEGLQEGDQIILNPKLEGLKEGKKVKQS